MILCVLGAAWAVDAHGTAVVPSGGEAMAPLVTWDPATSWKGAWGIGLTTEYAKAPLVAHLSEGTETREEAWLDDLGGTTLTGVYTFGRFGLGAGVPLWWMRTGEADSGVALGDVNLWAPIRLLDGDTGLLLVPRVELPTGDAEAWLGAKRFGAGLDAALGRRGPKLGGSLQLGLSYRPEDTLVTLDRSLDLRLGIAADWRATRTIGIGAEAWASMGLLDAAPLGSTSGEALARVGLDLMLGLHATLAGGVGIADGIGSSDARAWLRLGYGGVPAPEAPLTPTPVLRAGPYTLRVDVVDEAGRPLDATVSVAGDETVDAQSVGKDGFLDIELRPGQFSVDITAPGRVRQRFEVSLDEDRFVPAEVRSVLHRARGDQAVRVVVLDAEGRLIEGAEVSIDGLAQGRSPTGGVLSVTGLEAGAHRIDVAAPDFRAEPMVELPAGEAEAKLVLDRLPGSVQVVCRGPDGPVPDAQVRFSGPEDHDAEAIGEDGKQTFLLAPGDWELLVSAASFGMQTRTLHVSPGSTALVEVDVRLRPDEAGDASLLVRVTDPDGNPVDGAMVSIDGAPLGASANGGELRVSGLAAGKRVLTVRGERHRDAPPKEVELRGGLREVALMLGYRPGSLEVVARGIEGAPTDAQVRFDGPEEIAPTSLGPDGRARFELAPGTWQLALSAPSYGLQEREVIVRSDDVQLVEVDARLLAERGNAGLTLLVKDADGKPAVGARVQVDGREAGTVGNTGELRLEGLAAGAHAVMVEGALFKPWTRQTELAAGDNTLSATMSWTPGLVFVRARGPDGPALDAIGRFYGPEDVPPTALVPDGSRRFGLAPGPWALVVSSETYGIAERELRVQPGASKVQEVDVRLDPSRADRATMLVMMVDPSGQPVPGATLTVGGAAKDAGSRGLVVLRDMEPGKIAISAAAPGFRPAPSESVQMDAGFGTRRIRMVPLPRPIEVVVKDQHGTAVPAKVRLVGPGAVVAKETGASGALRTEVLPGAWQVLVEAEGRGAFRADVDVAPGVDLITVPVALAASKLEVTATAVNLHEQVQFDFDQASILAGSYPLLEQVAAALILHPELLAIEVQGHTDAKGTEAYNLDLSQRRAEAVVAYLVRRGVDAGRLVPKGYGASKPIADNETESGRTKNRRVQFEIGSGRTSSR